MYGLTNEQVAENREKYGSNKLPEPKLKKWYHFAKDALCEKITMILIAIAMLQMMLGFLGVMELSEPLMIMFVLAIVTCIAVKTGLGVQKSAAELRAKTSIRYCDVIRNGQLQTINKDELVVGDVVCVGMGQEIFADGYLMEGKISVNNAAINGETKECKKTPIDGYVHKKTTSTDAYTNQNCLFAGTTVMSGEGKMIVTDVGVNTVNGDTLVKMQTLEAPKTALDIALDNLSGFISKWGTIAASITFIVLTVSGIMEAGVSKYFSNDIFNLIQKFAQNFSVALTIVVAAVPEGLPLIVKLVTNYDTWRWTEVGNMGLISKKMNDLLYLYGRDEFVKWCLDKFKSRKSFLRFDKEDELLLQFNQKEIDKYIDSKEKEMIISCDGEYKYGVVFAEKYFSELGNELCTRNPNLDYVAMVNVGTYSISYRTIKENIDVGQVAKRYGGGGHQKAAGSNFHNHIVTQFITNIFKEVGE